MNDLRKRTADLPGFEQRLLDELLVLVEREAGSTGGAPSGPRTNRRRRGPWLVAVAAMAIAIAVALPALLPAGTRTGADPAAAATLHRLARVALHRRTVDLPEPGQYVYTRSEYTQTMVYGVDDGSDFRYTEVAVRRIWIAPDGSGRLVEQSSDGSFPTPADEAAWEAAGSPDVGGGRGSDDTYDPGGLFFQDVSGFSTEPDQLREQVEALAEKTNESTFEAVGDLLRETYASPALRAALYDLAASLPDVGFVGEVTDELGRTGIAVARTADGMTQELIFNPRTSELLGESDLYVGDQVDIDAGSAVGTEWSTAYVESEVVDSAGPAVIDGLPRSHCVTIAPYTSRCEPVGGE